MFTLNRFYNYCFYCYFEQVSTGWEDKDEIDYRIQLNECSCSKSLCWKQSKWDQQKFLFIFLLKLCLFFYFICLMKILNQKATIGFVFGLATILCYIKPRSTTRITIIVHQFYGTFRGLQITLKNWNCCYIKLNEIRLKCFKFFF